MTESKCVYKLKKYKFNRYQKRYQFSSTKRFCSMGELLQYLKDWRSGYDAFYRVMGYCHYPEDKFKVEIKTPNPYAPREDLLPAEVILNARR